MDKSFCLDQLKACELFKGLNSSELNNLYESMVSIKMKPGDVLVNKGEISDCMYVLLSGRLLVKHPDGRVIAQIGRGQTVGEMGLITNETRSATVVAMRECLLLKLDRSRFQNLWTRHPSVLFEVTKIITQRLQKTLKPPQRYNNDIHNVVLPANEQVNIKLFIKQLSTTFDQRFRYKMLKRSDFPDLLSEDHMQLQIQELEKQYDYLFYEVGIHEDKKWRDLCLGYADRIFVLADGSQPVNYSPEVVFLLTGSELPLEIKKNLVLLYDRSTMFRDTEAWLQPIAFFRHYHIHTYSAEDFARFLRLINGTAVGLVLSGGGTRSWAIVGVMKYIFEQQIPIDVYAGTSAGAINAAALSIARDYKDYFEIGARLGEEISFNEYTIPLGSILSSKSLTSTLKAIFGNIKIEDLDRKLFCIAADLFSSKEVDIQQGLLWLGVRASASIPGIYPPVYIQNTQKLLVDGGVLNNLPVDVVKGYFEDFGKIIAVDISGSINEICHYNYPMELTWGAILRHKTFASTEQLIIPSIMNTFIEGLMLSSTQKTKSNAMLSNIYIKPNLEGFPMLDQSRNQELIDTGYACAEKALANWREKLSVISR